MHWDGYTTFSVLSGISLAAMGLLFPRGTLSAKDRFYALLGGAFFFGYGMYAGHAKSGVFLFPVWIFIAPFVCVGCLILSYVGRPSQQRTADRATTSRNHLR